LANFESYQGGKKKKVINAVNWNDLDEYQQ
jgi:hypothetical protein